MVEEYWIEKGSVGNIESLGQCFPILISLYPLSGQTRGMSTFMYQVVCSLKAIKQVERLRQNFVENGLKQQKNLYHKSPPMYRFVKLSLFYLCRIFGVHKLSFFMMRITSILFGTERDLNNFGFRLNRVILFVKNVILPPHFKRFVITRKLLMMMVFLKTTCGFTAI